MKKVLVRAPKWLGDAVVATIFLSRLKRKFPEAEIDVLGTASLAPLFSAHPDVHAFLPLPYHQGGDIFTVGKLIRDKGYEAIYILPRSFRTAFEAWLSKVPRRIGYSGDLRSLFLTEVHSYDEDSFYAHRYLKLIGEGNIPLDDLHPFFPKASLTADEAAHLLGSSLDKFKKPYLGMAPASVAPARTWEPEKFTEVANRFLKDTGGTVILFGSEKEKPVTDQIRKNIAGPVIDSAGKLNFPQLGWLMSQCDFLAANDSGLMHVASAFEIPTVVIFGPSNPRPAIPRVGQFHAIQHTEIPCVPCLRNECVRLGSGYKECMKVVSSDEVLGALKKLNEPA